MSILKELIVLFTANTGGLKKGAKEAETATDKVEKKLDKTTKTSEKLGESLLKNASSFVKLVSGGYAFNLLSSGVRSMIAQGQELAKTSQYINVNIEDLQAWGRAVQLAGGNADDFQKSLSSVAQHFQIPESAAMKLFPKIADNLSKLSQFGARRYGEFLGLTPSTIMLLQQGRREVDAMVKKQKEFAVFTKEDAIQLLSLNRALNSTKVSLDGLYTNLARDTVPVLTTFLEAIDKVVKYFSQHYEVLEGGGIAAGIVGIGVAIRGLIGFFAQLNPLLRTALLLMTGIGLIYEDVRKTIEGSTETLGYKVLQFKEKITTSRPLEYFKNLAKKDENNITNEFSLSKISPLAKIGLAPSAPISNKTQNVTIGDVIINTQASNPTEISEHFMNFLNGQFAQSNAYFDSGVT